LITRFVEVWLLPPGILIVVLVTIGVFLLRRASRLAGGEDAGARALLPFRHAAVVILALAALLYLLSMSAVSRMLLGPLERRVKPASETELNSATAVVVLGGGLTVVGAQAVSATVLVAGPDRFAATLPPEALVRVVEGVLLARLLEVPLVLSGGRVFSAASFPTEAEVASALAERIGNSQVEIWIEAESRSTAENAVNVAALLGSGPVALVTSASHLPRAVHSFERTGLAVLPVPTAYRADRRPFHPVMLLPTADALEQSATWMREQLGRLWYAIRGI